MAVDEVILTGSYLGEDHRARQVGHGDRQFVQIRAGPRKGHVLERDGLGPEPRRSANVVQQPGEVRTVIYRRAPGIHTYRELAEILPAAERDAFRARGCEEAKTNPHVASAAELLFALDEPTLAEQLILDRAGELDGRNYVLLTELAKTAKVQGRLLAAALIWRALLDAILARGYAKAYGHGARYLLELRDLATRIDDYRGHPAHESYESAVRLGHGRKVSFWARLSAPLDPE